ncbi:MAG: nucleotidyltransferase domain-containing protein [Thermodesulfovibrionales bacterium]|nr:nucleotidyltransferase domain-containing protein [Thermodesulfovibrionales bacterium]
MSKTALIDEYKRLKRKRYEDKRKETLNLTHEALTELAKTISFKKAYIFGSILTSRFTDESDVDIAFEGLDDSVFFKAMAFLSDYIRRDVDVVQIEAHRLKDKIIKEAQIVIHNV